MVMRNEVVRLTPGTRTYAVTFLRLERPPSYKHEQLEGLER
jgi:hypothetical protein